MARGVRGSMHVAVRVGSSLSIQSAASVPVVRRGVLMPNLMIEGPTPVNRPPFPFGGERREIHKPLIKAVMVNGEIESGCGVCKLPSFIVSKESPGQFRCVQ